MYSKVSNARLYPTKVPITAADLLNDKVLPFYDLHELPMLHFLTDRGMEYCIKAKQHEYKLYLAVR